MARLPQHHQVRFAQGRYLLAAGNNALAAEALLAANRARPEHGHSLAYAAVALQNSGNADKARATAIDALYLALRDEEVRLARNVLNGVEGKGEIEVPLQRIATDGVFEALGEMRLRDTGMGLRVDITLSSASSGPNMLHLHENPSCNAARRDGELVAGLSAGAHLGEDRTGAGGHAHHAGHEGMTKDADEGTEMAMQATGTMSDASPSGMSAMQMPAHPMIMDMQHGNHKMKMVMRSMDLPIGDLPPLLGDSSGEASMSYFVPYLHTAMLRDRSVVVHKGMEAARAVCGVIR